MASRFLLPYSLDTTLARQRPLGKAAKKLHGPLGGARSEQLQGCRSAASELAAASTKRVVGESELQKELLQVGWQLALSRSVGLFLYVTRSVLPLSTGRGSYFRSTVWTNIDPSR